MNTVWGAVVETMPAGVFAVRQPLAGSRVVGATSKREHVVRSYFGLGPSGPHGASNEKRFLPQVRPGALLNKAAKPVARVLQCARSAVGKRERRVRLSATSGGAASSTYEEPPSYPHVSYYNCPGDKV